MTIGNDIRLMGYRSNLATNGSTVETPYGSISALVAMDTMITCDGPTGEDAREMVSIDTQRGDISAQLKSQDKVTVDGQVLRIVRRDDNPANPITRFWAQKVL